MSPMRLIILVVAAMAAIGAAFLVRGMSNEPAQRVDTAPQVIEREVEVSATKVLVAAAEMPTGSLLTPEDFQWADWPERALNPAYYTQDADPEAVEELAGSVVKTPLL